MAAAAAAAAKQTYAFQMKHKKWFIKNEMPMWAKKTTT